MAPRHTVILLLFLAVALAPAVLDPGSSAASPSPEALDVPREALDAMRQGRYWRASRILREYLAAVPEPEPETVLLTAQAEAGWGGWAQVESLLSGRGWLDTVADGYGWKLLGRSRYQRGDWEGSDEALARYLDVARVGGDRDRGLTEVRRAHALAGRGDTDAALRAYTRAVDWLPQLADWIHLAAAEVAAEAGDTAAVRSHLDATAPALAAERGWRLRIRGYRKAGALTAALRAAESATHSLDTAADRALAWETIGSIQRERGDAEAAAEAFRRAIAAAPETVAAVDAARQLMELSSLTPAEQLLVGRVFLRHGNVQRAVSALDAYLDAGAGTPLERAEIRLDVARALFRAGRYADAERIFLALAENAPSTRIAADALFQAGRAQYRQGRRQEGLATFRHTAARFPREPVATEALFLVADLAHDDAAIDTARTYYRRAVEAHPDANDAGLALMRLGGIAFVEGEHERAAELFEEYRRRHPRGRRIEQATYWAAKAYIELGRESRARALLERVHADDPLSYYGLRAASMIGAPRLDIGAEPAPADHPETAAEVAAGLDRIDLLRDLEWDDAAETEVDRLRRHFAGREEALYTLAEALNARGYTVTGIRLGWAIYEQERAWNPRLLRIVYPFPYRDMIVAEAEERGLDPFLVAGLIRQESMFNADARSHAGARGLMQIIPETGRTLARQAGIRTFEVEALHHPEINVHLGTAYLAELLDRFDGRLPAVLAAYNAGPHRVQRWREFPEYVDDELFAERIPYSETRHYAKVVQRNAELYRALYATATAPPE